jgi:hypothetical protein
MIDGTIDYDPGKCWNGEKWMISKWSGRENWLKVMYKMFWRSECQLNKT